MNLRKYFYEFKKGKPSDTLRRGEGVGDLGEVGELKRFAENVYQEGRNGVKAAK